MAPNFQRNILARQGSRSCYLISYRSKVQLQVSIATVLGNQTEGTPLSNTAQHADYVQVFADLFHHLDFSQKIFAVFHRCHGYEEHD